MMSQARHGIQSRPEEGAAGIAAAAGPNLRSSTRALAEREGQSAGGEAATADPPMAMIPRARNNDNNTAWRTRIQDAVSHVWTRLLQSWWLRLGPHLHGPCMTLFHTHPKLFLLLSGMLFAVVTKSVTMLWHGRVGYNKCAMSTGTTATAADGNVMGGWPLCSVCNSKPMPSVITVTMTATVTPSSPPGPTNRHQRHAGTTHSKTGTAVPQESGSYDSKTAALVQEICEIYVGLIDSSSSLSRCYTCPSSSSFSSSSYSSPFQGVDGSKAPCAQGAAEILDRDLFEYIQLPSPRWNWRAALHIGGRGNNINNNNKGGREYYSWDAIQMGLEKARAALVAEGGGMMTMDITSPDTAVAATTATTTTISAAAMDWGDSMGEGQRGSGGDTRRIDRVGILYQIATLLATDHKRAAYAAVFLDRLGGGATAAANDEPRHRHDHDEASESGTQRLVDDSRGMVARRVMQVCSREEWVREVKVSDG